jgi:hypothetical protein
VLFKLHRHLAAACAILAMVVSVLVLPDLSHRAAPMLPDVAADLDGSEPASPVSDEPAGLDGEHSASADHPMIAPDDASAGVIPTRKASPSSRADTLLGGVASGGLDRPPRA